MALKTKCIKKPREESDGWRLSIMSRHTLDDGTTPDPEIALEMYDEWCPKFAPRPRLIGAYKREEISWEKFEWEFMRYLASPKIQPALCSLARAARQFDITILCVEETPEHCHRRLVAEACKKIDPSLEIVIE